MVRLSIATFLIAALLAVPVCGATYYVDQAHPSASDSNAGTEALPWKTITKAANTVTAGDTVIVKAGTYAEQVTLLSPHAGQPGQLITFKANPGDPVVIDGGQVRQHGFRVGVSYVRIEGFEVINVTGHGILVGWSEGSARGVEIVNNTVHDCGGSNPDTAAVYYSGGHHGLIENNRLYNNAGDGITFFSADMTIRNNRIHHNQTDGMKGGGGGLILIEGNTINNMDNVANHGDGMQLMGMTGTLVVRNNTVWDCTQNIYCDTYSNPAGSRPWGDVYIYNNVVFNTIPGPTGIEGHCNGIVNDTRFNSWRSLTVCGNTLVNLNNGSGGLRVSAVALEGGKIDVVKVCNNLFYNSTNSTGVTALQEQGSQVQMDYNIYYNQWRNWYFGENWVNLAQFRITHPDCEQNSFYSSDVTFVNYALLDPDFHLAEGSAAIDKGCNIPAVGEVHFDTDHDGLARPQGPAWDVGAYEYVAPAAGTITDWSVAATHGAAGELVTTADENYIESRAGGIVKVRITFSSPLDPATVNNNSLGIVGQVNGDQASRISGITLTGGNTVLVVQFSSPLPDADRYTATVSDTVKYADGSAISGSRVRRLSALAGDVDSSGLVGAEDILAVRSRAGQGLTAATARYDVDGSGTITTADMLATKLQLGNLLP
ncbi:MAG: DUF1565 domain-containing protein [Anaerolineaceae bacterium]|nr:DUF1565 domain-containing protein [Anaerolineaceae bacterium]